MITFTVNATGTPDEADIRAAMLIVNDENGRRTAENERRAALDPPEDPVALLPTGTLQERVASYRTVLANIVASAHASYVQTEARQSAETVRDRWKDATEEQRQQIRTILGA